MRSLESCLCKPLEIYVVRDTTLEFFYVLLYDILHHNIRNHSNKEIVLHIVCIGFQTIHVSDRIICLHLPTSGSASLHSILSLNRTLYLLSLESEYFVKLLRKSFLCVQQRDNFFVLL